MSRIVVTGSDFRPALGPGPTKTVIAQPETIWLVATGGGPSLMLNEPSTGVGEVTVLSRIVITLDAKQMRRRGPQPRSGWHTLVWIARSSSRLALRMARSSQVGANGSAAVAGVT